MKAALVALTGVLIAAVVGQGVMAIRRVRAVNSDALDLPDDRLPAVRELGVAVANAEAFGDRDGRGALDHRRRRAGVGGDRRGRRPGPGLVLGPVGQAEPHGSGMARFLATVRAA